MAKIKYLKKNRYSHHKSKYKKKYLEKIILTSNLGIDMQNSSYLEKNIYDLKLISGQFPLITYSKKSIANFKIRKGMPIGLKITLRKFLMYSFLEHMIYFILPQNRNEYQIDKNYIKNNNLNFGIMNNLIFPESSYKANFKNFGFNITIVSKLDLKNFNILKNLKLINYEK